MFRDGRHTMDLETNFGRLVSTQTEKNAMEIRTLIRSDRHLMTGMMNDKLNLNHETVHEISTNEQRIRTDMYKNSLKWNLFSVN